MVARRTNDSKSVSGLLPENQINGRKASTRGTQGDVERAVGKISIAG